MSNLPHRIDQLNPGPPHPLDQPNPDSGHPGESMSESLHGSSDTPAEQSEICHTCARFLPVSHFRFRNRATGVRMTECRACFNRRETTRNRKKRAREKGWAIHKTASQITRSPDLGRSLALLENLVDVMGGPEKLVETWHTECWRLTTQKRSSTRLARMYEMLITLAGQLRRK
jgi:hypothetical protein